MLPYIILMNRSAIKYKVSHKLLNIVSHGSHHNWNGKREKEDKKRKRKGKYFILLKYDEYTLSQDYVGKSIM